MNFQKLQYFIDIADSGSISAAARKNFMAQQSMSANLQNLEKYYGVKLFLRSAPLRLTEEGRRLYDTAVTVLGLMRDFEESLHADDPPLVIGLAYNGTPPFLVDLIDYVNDGRSVPLDVQVQANCDSPTAITDDVDLVIGIHPPEGFERLELLRDKWVVAVTRELLEKTYGGETENVIARVTASGSLEELRELPFSAFTPSNVLPPFLKGMNIVSKGNSSDISTNLLLKKKCAIVVAEDYAQRAFGQIEDMVFLPIKTGKEDFSLYLYYRRDKKISDGARQFIQAAGRFLAEP